MVCEPVQIGPYRLVRKLGQGGMGEVFEAIHESLARRVALKRMLPRFAHDSRANRRFIKEARAVNLIGHPGLVQVSDFCVLPDGSPYLVMEYLQGETLAERLRDLSRPLSLQQVVHICWQLSSILSATHAKGIVHRDMKLAIVPSRNENGTGWGKRREKRRDDHAAMVGCQSVR